MRKLFRALSAVLILLAIALVSALITMRLAIHGAEVRVPKLTGLSLSDAAARLHENSLETGVDGRFYSTTEPAGYVLTQSPPPGTRVRKSWRVRITVSLGPQKVAIPSLEGMDERIATITIHRTGLQLGNIVPVPYAYAPANTVIAQTPLSKAMDVAGPKIGLLVAEPVTPQPDASVMPDLTGDTFTAAAWTVMHAGFQLAPVQNPTPALTAPLTSSAYSSSLSAGIASSGAVTGSQASAASGTVIAQVPAAGSRIPAGATIQLTVQP